jgi:predicted nuclease with TOPRIM domain
MLELRDKLKKRLESPRKDRHDLQEKHKRLQAQIDNNRDCMRREADRRIELEEVNQRLQGEVEVRFASYRGNDASGRKGSHQRET